MRSLLVQYAHVISYLQSLVTSSKIFGSFLSLVVPFIKHSIKEISILADKKEDNSHHM